MPQIDPTSDVDRLFAAAAQVMRQMAILAAEKRERRRMARNERARRRYAISKQAGILPKRTQARTNAVTTERDWEPITACYCNATPRPPCSFCECGAGCDDEDQDQA